MKSKRIVIGTVIAVVSGARRHPVASSQGSSRRQLRHRVEPDRHEHAHRAPGTGRRSPACRADTRGDGPGSGLRRGQRDRVQALPAATAEQAILRTRLEGRRPRHRGRWSPPQHRLHRAALSETARATLLQSLATEYATWLAGISNGPFKKQGIAAGNAAAQAMITARQDDGRFEDSQWVPNTAPGHWWPLGPPRRPCSIPRREPAG
jgi:hypothetical protein